MCSRLQYVLSFISITFTSFCVCFVEGRVTVNLKQGILSGLEEKTFLNQKSFYTFRGIPFALPPIGELRFKPPEPLNSWDGTYKAHEVRPTCLQASGRRRNDEPPGVSGSEDCLYLSVFTPSLQNEMPVIVFDYTDNFRTGFNSSDTYSPDFFLEEDVIVVHINHRLGVFGYLTTEDDVIPGNAGIKDFLLGLQWVKDNIAEFGGDPSRVTLMGNRGGAAMADILLYSEKAKGLFSAVMLQSGTSLEPIYFPNNTKQNAFLLGEILGVITDDSATLLVELQNKNISELILNEYKATNKDDIQIFQRSMFPFAPVVEPVHEDSVLSSLPEESQIINDVPVVIGFNSREGLDVVSHYLFQPQIINEMAVDFFFHFPRRTSFVFDKNSTIYEEALMEVKNYYLTNGYFDFRNILEYSIYVGDVLHLYAVDHAVQELSKKLKSPIYYYIFDFNGSINENMVYITKFSRIPLKNWGATVADELCYLHLCNRIRKNYEQLRNLVSEQPEFKVLKKMVRMWTQFAKTRNPTPKDDPVLKEISWEPLRDPTERNYLHITKKMTMKINPLQDRIQFWDNFIAKYSQLAVDGIVKDPEITHEEL